MQIARDHARGFRPEGSACGRRHQPDLRHGDTFDVATCALRVTAKSAATEMQSFRPRAEEGSFFAELEERSKSRRAVPALYAGSLQERCTTRCIGRALPAVACCCTNFSEAPNQALPHPAGGPLTNARTPRAVRSAAPARRFPWASMPAKAPPLHRPGAALSTRPRLAR